MGELGLSPAYSLYPCSAAGCDSCVWLVDITVHLCPMGGGGVSMCEVWRGLLGEEDVVPHGSGPRVWAWVGLEIAPPPFIPSSPYTPGGVEGSVGSN